MDTQREKSPVRVFKLLKSVVKNVEKTAYSFGSYCTRKTMENSSSSIHGAGPFRE
jgi:hypothetical protein